MKHNAQRMAGTPLTEEEHRQLRTLAALPDDQIDFSEIPERTYDMEAPSLPLESHTLTLTIDAEVAAWLEESATHDPGKMNLLLKRTARRNGHLASTLRKAS